MNTKSRLIYIPADGDEIQGDLRIPEDSKAIVIFAHGSGSSRHSPRNQYVAGVLNDGRIATLLIDLLTPDEEWWILKLRSSDSTRWGTRANRKECRRIFNKKSPARKATDGLFLEGRIPVPGTRLSEPNLFLYIVAKYESYFGHGTGLVDVQA